MSKAADFNGSKDFASFVLAGLAFTDALLRGPDRTVARGAESGQTSGTLEPVLLTPVRTWQFILGSSAFEALLAFVRTAFFVFSAVVFLGYWHNANVPGVVLVFVPAFATFLGLGLLAAAFTMVVKQGDPIVGGYMALSGLLGGTIIPVVLLPGWVQAVAQLLPLTHALRGLRLALDGAAYSTIAGPIAVLTVMAIMALPFGLYAVTWATQRARQEGSLVVY